MSIPSGFVVRMNKPQDWKAVIAKVVGPRSEEARHDGQSYIRQAGGPITWGFYTPDDRTLVIAAEVVLRDLIADRNAPAPGIPGMKPGRRSTRGR